MDRAHADTPDVEDDEPWVEPGMSPMRKVGLTLLMVMLGVIPGLLLLASDPLGNSSDELAPESNSIAEGAGAGNEVPVTDVAPPTDGAPPDAPIPDPVEPDPVEEDAPGSDPDTVEPDTSDPEREPRRHHRHQRSSQADDGSSATPAEVEEAEDGEADVATPTEEDEAAPEAPTSAPRHCLVLVCFG